MIKSYSQKTLSELIRQKIAKRIVFCAIFLTLFLVALTAYDLSKIFSTMSENLKKTTHELSELIISQSLIHNEKTLPFTIAQMNLPEGNRAVWLKNNHRHKKGFVWTSFLSWKYLYPVKTMDNQHFGSIEISGNLSENADFFREFWIRIFSLLFVILTMSFLLLPLSNKIPHELFVSPINYLLNLLRYKDKAQESSIKIEKNIASEIREVIDNVVDLVEKEKKDTAMETINLLAKKMVHDIRSPLSVLDTTLLDIKQDIPEFEYALLHEAIQRVRDTSNNLFACYRENIDDTHNNDSNIERHVSLALLLEMLVVQKRQEWRKNPCKIVVEIDENAKIFWIKAVSNEIKRVISNILNNAYEAIHDNREILIQLKPQENMLCLTVRDFGIGIPSEKIAAVLSGLSLKHEGTGIGLSSALQYMQSINGRLEISSILHEGTCVTLFFPITE